VYVPAAKPDIVVFAVFPVIDPGLIVQFPVGNPFNTTLPVATVQVGCVIVPAVGADGVAGCAVIVTLVPVDIHPAALFAVTVYVLAATALNIPVVFV
jgi:hypothetical protein